MSIGCLMNTKPFQKDGRTIRFTKEALEGSCEDLNRNAHIPLGVDHDPSMMPVGRTDRAWITKIEEEWHLFAEFTINTEAEKQFHQSSGTYIADLNVGGSSKGICSASSLKNKEGIRIDADRTDFDEDNSWEEFSSVVKSRNCGLNVKEYGRNSLESVAGYLLISLGIWMLVRFEKFSRHIVDETMRKVGDELSDKWSKSILEILSSFEKSSSKRMNTYHALVTISGEIDLVFVLDRKKQDSSLKLDSFNFSQIASVVSCYSDIIENAQEITLIQSSDGAWKFHHMKMKDGNIVGDWNNYEKSVKRWQELQAKHGKE
ncbi:MAG: hypothetical protein OXL41_12660 [Nitrospinae bacterium]|nr:hypothetical protein [Nitrospinota bacterium]